MSIKSKTSALQLLTDILSNVFSSQTIERKKMIENVINHDIASTDMTSLYLYEFSSGSGRNERGDNEKSRDEDD